MTQEYKIVHYIEDGQDIFLEWLENLKDFHARNTIRKNIRRLQNERSKSECY